MLDQTDRELIELLRLEPRAGNRQLAQALGVSEVTVASRLRSLFERGMVRATVKTDIAKLGQRVLAVVGVHVRKRDIDEVVAALCDFDEIIAVTPTLGSTDIVIQVTAEDDEALVARVLPRIARVKGVYRLESDILLDVRKFSIEYGKLS